MGRLKRQDDQVAHKGRNMLGMPAAIRTFRSCLHSVPYAFAYEKEAVKTAF